MSPPITPSFPGYNQTDDAAIGHYTSHGIGYMEIRQFGCYNKTMRAS
jgi:hypothetical protein